MQFDAPPSFICLIKFKRLFLQQPVRFFTSTMAMLASQCYLYSLVSENERAEKYSIWPLLCLFKSHFK